MTKIIKPWVLVSIGIIFNIFSAVITHYFIDINNQSIRNIENQIITMDALIDSQWRNKTQVERKEEFLLSMLASIKLNESTNNEELRQLIDQQLSLMLEQQNIELIKPQINAKTDFNSIASLANEVKNKLIASINNTYLEKLELDDQKHPLTEQNALLSTLAIFLQISGLILVLSKDINF